MAVATAVDLSMSKPWEAAAAAVSSRAAEPSIQKRRFVKFLESIGVRRKQQRKR
jgi:hypothetical protein